MRIHKHLAFLSMAVAAAAIVVGVFSWGSGKTQAASIGTATFSLTGAPGANVPVGNTFTVTTNIAAFNPATACVPADLNSGCWGGYDIEVTFDGTVIKPQPDNDTSAVTMAGTNPCGAFWAAAAANSAAVPPQVVTGCAFQASTYTGALETITFKCAADGATNITFVPRGGDPSGAGSALFNQNAVDYDMTFVNTSVQCGTGAILPTNTPTNTATATNTPAATNTPNPTATATNTTIPATATAQAAATQTAQNNFGGAVTATPTPGGETATPAATDTPSSGGGSPVPTTPGGGQGGAVGTPTKPGGGQGAGITGPNTGTGGAQQGGNGLPAGWLIIGGIMLALAGGGLYVRSRKVQ